MQTHTLKFWNYTPEEKPEYKGKFCGLPWSSIVVDNDGDVLLCDCPLHMPHSIGNIYNQSLTEIWNGAAAQQVRQSVVDGNFTYCSRSCAHLPTLKAPPKNLPVAPLFPRNIKIDMDWSCNLKCASCRENVIIEKNNAKIERQKQLYQEIKDWALANPLHHMIVTPVNSGEVFASHSGLAFLHSLVDYPHHNLKLHITSNGTLIKKNQDLVQALSRIIVDWSISVDAATRETYAQVRGGNWDDLLAGLDIISASPIARKMFKMCIQKKNFHEIEQFAHFTTRYGAVVNYQRLMDWGHWDPNWWKNNMVFEQKNAEAQAAVEGLRRAMEAFPSHVTLAADMHSLVSQGID